MLRERIITALLLLPLVVGVILYGGIPLVALGFVSCYWINYEYFNFATSFSKLRCMQLSFCVLLLPSCYLALGFAGLPVSLLIAAIVMFFLHLSYLEADVHQIDFEKSLPASMMSLSYTGLFGTTLVIVCHRVPAELILWLLFVVMSADTFAYFGGRAIGGMKLAPRVSPKKTVSGAVCGTLGAVAMSLGLGLYLELPLAMFVLGALGFLIAIFAIAGDLVESLIKRTYGVKDSGTILPGHGGLLDRLDAVLFSLPILLFL